MAIYSDHYDLELTAASETSVRGIEQFGNAILAFSNKIGGVLSVADIDQSCPIVQAYAAQVLASTDTRDGLRQSRLYLDRAVALKPEALPREKKIIRAAEHWCRTERRAAARVLDEVLDEYPNDLITAKWAQALHFETGNSQGILAAPKKVAARHDGNAYLHGMLAFGYEECHQLDEAERSVMRALEIKRAEPWAHHAMAHVCEARNSLQRGVDFMLDMSDTWTDLISFMVTHNWWHTALLLIDLNRTEEALACFDKEVWSQDRTCVQDQINAISLLYRLERVGVDVGDRWSSIADVVADNAESQISVLLDFQFLYALARAHHTEAQPMAERIVDAANTSTLDERAAWRDVAVYLAPGVLALACGDYPRAADNISKARPSLQKIGGSHAQRDLVALFYIDALRGAGNWSRAQKLLAIRYQGRPKTSWIRHQLSEAHERSERPPHPG